MLPTVRAQWQDTSASSLQFPAPLSEPASHGDARERITFELDLFSAFQQHHDVDDDYIQRKGRPDSVQLWAVGQAEAVARATDLFARPGYGTEGVFPQLYFYDCHSCHRPITDGDERRLQHEEAERELVVARRAVVEAAQARARAPRERDERDERDRRPWQLRKRSSSSSASATRSSTYFSPTARTPANTRRWRCLL